MVWIDQLDIKPGRPWYHEVEQATIQCAEMIVLLSPSSVDSPKVMNEVLFALEENKAVIPVMHLDCRVPMQLRQLQYVDFRADYASGLRILIPVLGGTHRCYRLSHPQTPPEVAKRKPAE